MLLNNGCHIYLNLPIKGDGVLPDFEGVWVVVKVDEDCRVDVARAERVKEQTIIVKNANNEPALTWKLCMDHPDDLG